MYLVVSRLWPAMVSQGTIELSKAMFVCLIYASMIKLICDMSTMSVLIAVTVKRGAV